MTCYRYPPEIQDNSVLKHTVGAHINIRSKTVHKGFVSFILEDTVTALMKNDTDGIFRYILLSLRTEFSEELRLGE